MKSNTLLSAAAAAAVANGALLLGLVGGSAYIFNCERRATAIGQCDAQWLTGLSFMGIGGAAKGGWSVGYNTENTKISRSEAPAAPAAPRPVPTVRRKVEEAVVDQAADQIKAILSRGGR